MKLVGVKKGGGWLYSEWNLTYRVGWSRICKAVQLIYHDMKDPEILSVNAGGDAKISVNDEEEILSLEESGHLTVRGLSGLIGVPIMITFFNQLDLVRVTVACATDEFAEADYEKFNLSMCQYLDSAELAMYS